MKFVNICRAIYDYNSQNEEELSFKENDILYILENDDSDWYKAQLKTQSTEEDGPIGLVPANYLEKAQSIGSITAIYAYNAQAEEELSFKEDDTMVLYEKDDPDWFLVEKNGSFGLVPSNYVEENLDTTTTTTTTNTSTTIPVAETPTVKVVEERGNDNFEKTHPLPSKNDEALSWSVNEYDIAKKKKTKGRGNLMVGNGMLCYGSETDKASPVRQFNISQVVRASYDVKNVHIEVAGNHTFDFQAASKSEAKSIVTKIEASKLLIASPSSTSLAAPSVASDHQSEVTSIYDSPASSFQSLPQQQQQQPEHPRARSPLPPAPVEPEPAAPICEAKWAVALYQFTPEGGEETSLEQHEQVLVTDYVSSNDWWTIEHKDGKSGVVPATYIQFHEDFEAQQAKARASEELELKKQQEENERRQREEKEEQQRRQEEERKREQDEILKKQMEEQERRQQQEEKEKARQLEAERRRKMQEEAKQKELEAKRMVNFSAAATTSSPQLGNSSPRRSQIPAPPPPSIVKPAPPVHNDPTKPDPSKLRTWTDNTGAFKVDAQLLSCNNGKIRLHKTNGVKIEVPVQKMCSADLRYIEQEIGIKLIEDKSDDIPLAQLTHGFTWYNFFKKLNFPLEACARYAKAFENEDLTESDVEKLTHRRMKSLGMSEKHVQRLQRFIETNVPEPPSDDERPRGGISKGKKKVKKSVTFGATSIIQDNSVDYNDGDYDPAEIQRQIESDEEYARRLQQQEEMNSSPHHGNSGLHRRGTGRPTPTHTAPRDVNTSAFSQFSLSTEPLKPTPSSASPQPPLATVNPPVSTTMTATPPMVPVAKSGFEDDAWAPRAVNSSTATPTLINHNHNTNMNNNSNNNTNSPLSQPPTQQATQPLTLDQVNSTRPVPQIPGRQRPTPQLSQQNLVDPELLAKWKGSPSLAAANSRPVPPPPVQSMSSNASLSNQASSMTSIPANTAAVGAFAQQNQQGSPALFSGSAHMLPAAVAHNTLPQQNRGITPSPQTIAATPNLPLQSALQPALVPGSASPLNNNNNGQPTGFHPQMQQQQPTGFGNHTNNSSFGTPTMFNNTPVQQQPTGFSNTPVQQQQATGFNNTPLQQQQATGFNNAQQYHQQPTGFGVAGATAAQVQQPTGFGIQQHQPTGYSPQIHQATGFNQVQQQPTGFNNSMQQGFGPQPTGPFGPQSTGSSMNSTWSNATPDNPFGINTQNPNMMQNASNLQNSFNMNYQHQNIPAGMNSNDKYSVFKTVDANAPSVFNSNSQNNGAFQQPNYTNHQGRW